MITNLQLVEYVKKALGCPYWYGTFGQYSTKALYNAKKKQYPNEYTWQCPDSQLGVHVFDCVGLIKGSMWSDADFNKKPVYKRSEDVSANGMYVACTTLGEKHGDIANIPEVPGVLVFCTGHVGVYIGDGYVIEARGHYWGVIKSELKDRPFRYYAYCPYIKYVTTPEKTKQKSKYFRHCKETETSIVDALISIGENHLFGYRKKIAAANGIKNYHGSYQQNVDMLNMLKAGKLKKP